MEEGQQASHTGPREPSLEIWTFFPQPRGTTKGFKEEQWMTHLFFSLVRVLSRLGFPTHFLPPGQFVPTAIIHAKVRVRDCGLPLGTLKCWLCCHLATLSAGLKGALYKEKVPWFQTQYLGKKQLADPSQVTRRPAKQVTTTLPFAQKGLGPR